MSITNTLWVHVIVRAVLVITLKIYNANENHDRVRFGGPNMSKSHFVIAAR